MTRQDKAIGDNVNFQADLYDQVSFFSGSDIARI